MKRASPSTLKTSKGTCLLLYPSEYLLCYVHFVSTASFSCKMPDLPTRRPGPSAPPMCACVCLQLQDGVRVGHSRASCAARRVARCTAREGEAMHSP